MTVRDLIPRSLRTKHLPITHEDANPFSLLHHEMGSLFDRFYRTFDVGPWFEEDNGFFSPKIDVTEGEKEIRVTAELPGIDENDVEVLLGRDSLTIRGEKKDERENRGKDYYHSECSYGSFSRMIPLPEEVNTEKAEAHYRKGVLTVTLPRTEETIKDTKKINVKVE
jgi:HSP20 family protein